MNPLQATAIDWINRGVAPIPVIHKSKIPATEWRMWKDRIPPVKVVSYWFRDPNINLGVVCGGPSNLAIIDFDNIDYYYDWRKEMISRNDIWSTIPSKTYRVRTPRGMHVYLKTDSREQSRKYPDTQVDVRCSGNYTLVPPSIHPSGSKYESIGDPDNIIKVSTLQTIFPEQTYKQLSKTTGTDFDQNIFSQASKIGITELKSRIPILSFVGQLTNVKRGSSDGRFWWAHCIHPSHADRHPSFCIDTVSNRAKCMSSSCKLYHPIGLDIIDLYSIIYNTTVGNAIRELETIYGY